MILIEVGDILLRVSLLVIRMKPRSGQRLSFR